MSQGMFRLRDCPDQLTFIDWVKSETDWAEAEARAKPKREYPPLMALEGPQVDLDELRESVVEAMKLYGTYGWATADGERSNSYVGFSLNYNPDHEEGTDIHASSLGSSKVSKDSYFARFKYQEEKADTLGKNSYDDTYAFVERTPASRHKALGTLIDKFSRPLLRSRMSAMRASVCSQDKVLKIKYDDPDRCDAGWHRDEPVFVHLRVSVPVFTDPSFHIQIEDTVDEYLEPGMIYSFDTDVPHRPVATQQSDKVRIHLVLGFSPWLDYVEEEKAFVLNEFYGRLHPWDMLNEGLIYPNACVANC